MAKIYLDTISRGAIPVKFVGDLSFDSNRVEIKIIGNHTAYDDGELMQVDRQAVVTLVGTKQCRTATREQLLENKV